LAAGREQLAKRLRHKSRIIVIVVLHHFRPNSSGTRFTIQRAQCSSEKMRITKSSFPYRTEVRKRVRGLRLIDRSFSEVSRAKHERKSSFFFLLGYSYDY
jgi:hypothetical protein